MKTTRILLALGVATVLATGCDREAKFKIEGDVAGAEGKTMTLSKADYNGRWVVMDSVKIGKDGAFRVQSVAPASPEIYRLTLDGNSIYMPVDSIETLRLEASADKFAYDYTLTGTPQAERMAKFEKDLHKYASADGADAEGFKRQVYANYIQDSQGAIMSYYILTKIVDGKPLFDPANPGDTKYYAAVATQFEQFKPQDPHGKMVRQAAMEAMRKRNAEQGKRNVVEATEIRVLDVELQDENQRNVKLSDLVGKGSPVVVVFGMMNEQESPAFNIQLARIYNSRGGNVKFFHISFDADQYAWREAARNLPWTTVLDPAGTGSTALRDYNVAQLPTFFIYDAAGELRDRAASLDELQKKLASY